MIERDETKGKLFVLKLIMIPNLEPPLMDVLLWQVFGISDFLYLYNIKWNHSI